MSTQKGTTTSSKDGDRTTTAATEEGGARSPESQPAGGPELGAGIPDVQAGRPLRPLQLWWVRIVPFFLSAAFFLSALFILFAPMPVLFLYFRSGRKWAWAAAATNCAIVAALGGLASLGLYVVFVAAVALLLPEFLVRKVSIEKSGLATLVAMALLGASMVVGYSRVHHTNPAQVFRDNVDQIVKTIGQASSSVNKENGESTIGSDIGIAGGDADEWREELYAELPSAIAVFSLVLLWVNLVALIRTGVGGVRERYGLSPGILRSWRAPEWLVWPTIIAGFGLLLDLGKASDIAINAFKFLMAIYAIQGLSILSFFFDLWNIRGILRAFCYLVGVFLMMPLLLSLGFFDLWFDFRSKFRQS